MATIKKSEQGAPYISMYLEFKLSASAVEKAIAVMMYPNTVDYSTSTVLYRLQKYTAAQVEKQLRELVQFYGAQFEDLAPPELDAAYRPKIKQKAKQLFPDLFEPADYSTEL